MFSFLILKRLQHKSIFKFAELNNSNQNNVNRLFKCEIGIFSERSNV
ncbi:MAG: hypothetical protein LBH59_07625 [Planctomycetaceae bacterium]|nr:hypothetical protein [Planctomycetaceae bacterium]